VKVYRVVRRRRSYIFYTVGSQTAVRMSTLLASRALPPEIYSSTNFCYKLSKPQGHNAAGRMRFIEKINWPHRESNPRPSSCSIVPQPTRMRILIIGFCILLRVILTANNTFFFLQLIGWEWFASGSWSAFGCIKKYISRYRTASVV
jgi:hypothetical protein